MSQQNMPLNVLSTVYLLDFFSYKNMINKSWRILYDTSRQRCTRQILVWHHCGHVRYHTLIGVFYKINIHSSSQNGVFLSWSLVDMVSNDDIKWDTFPLECRYIPPKVTEIPLYTNSIKMVSHSYFEQSHDLVNTNRKCQYYVYIKWEHWSTMSKIKHN